MRHGLRDRKSSVVNAATNVLRYCFDLFGRSLAI